MALTGRLLVLLTVMFCFLTPPPQHIVVIG